MLGSAVGPRAWSVAASRPARRAPRPPTGGDATRSWWTGRPGRRSPCRCTRLGPAGVPVLPRPRRCRAPPEASSRRQLRGVVSRSGCSSGMSSSRCRGDPDVDASARLGRRQRPTGVGDRRTAKLVPHLVDDLLGAAAARVRLRHVDHLLVIGLAGPTNQLVEVGGRAARLVRGRLDRDSVANRLRGQRQGELVVLSRVDGLPQRRLVGPSAIVMGGSSRSIAEAVGSG